MEEIIRRIKIFEGYSAEPYICPAGKWTIGYGYNFQDRGFQIETLTEILKAGFTETTAERLLEADVRECMESAEKLFGFYRLLNEPRRAVVTDMIYQLGLAGFQQFRKMIRALRLQDYKTAADEMENSRWFAQSGRRSRINTHQMRTGEWQEVL